MHERICEEIDTAVWSIYGAIEEIRALSSTYFTADTKKEIKKVIDLLEDAQSALEHAPLTLRDR